MPQKHYAVIFSATPANPYGIVTSVFDSERAIETFLDLHQAGKIFEAPAEVQAGWVKDGGGWFPPQDPRVIASTDFMARFTPQEINEAASRGVVGGLLLLTVGAQTVNLDSVNGALDAMVAAGVITTERKNELLA